MPRRPRDRWGLWSEILPDGTERFYLGGARAIDRLPKGVEFSADRQWATLYETFQGKQRAKAVYVNLGPEQIPSRHTSVRSDNLGRTRS